MKEQDLYSKVVACKRIGLMPSLPVAFMDDKGDRDLAWFYYLRKKESDPSCARIDQIAVADEDLNVDLFDTDLEFDLSNTENIVLELSVEEFYELLIELLAAADFDYDAMLDLLARAVPNEMMDVYKKVVIYAKDYVNNTLKDESDSKVDPASEIDEILLKTFKNDK